MATLLVTTGVLEGTRFKLPDEPIVSVGRDDVCTIQILDPAISRKHLQIRRDGDTHVAADYRSANGILINGQRLDEDRELADGDRIRIGGTTMIYAVSDDADARSFDDIDRRRGQWGKSTIGD